MFFSSIKYWLLSNTLFLKVAFIASLILTIVVGYYSFKNSWIKEGRNRESQKWNATIHEADKINRSKERNIETSIDSRAVTLEAKKRRIRRRATDERKAIEKNEVVDGRIDPNTVKALENGSF